MEKFIEYINILLNFIGYRAEISENNTVNLYDVEGLYGSTTIRSFSPGYFIDFTDREGKRIECVVNCSDSYFQVKYAIRINSGNMLAISQENNKDGSFKKYTSIQMDINYFEERSFSKKGLTLTSEDFSASIGNENSERRSIYFGKFNLVAARMTEQSLENDGKVVMTGLTINENPANTDIIVFSDKKGEEFNVKTVSVQDRINMAKDVISHSRNRELILYVLNSCEKTFPGIKDFMDKNFEVYGEVVGAGYYGNEIIKYLVEENINHDCDLPPIGEQNKKG